MRPRTRMKKAREMPPAPNENGAMTDTDCPETALVSVDLRPSRQLFVLLLAGHVLAGVGVFGAPLDSGLRMGLLAALAAHFAYLAARDALLALPSSIVRVCLLEEGDLQLVFRSGISGRHRLSRTTAAWPGLTVLGLRGLAGWWRGVVLLPDCADAVTLRRLRMALRWKGGGAS